MFRKDVDGFPWADKKYIEDAMKYKAKFDKKYSQKQ